MNSSQVKSMIPHESLWAVAVFLGFFSHLFFKMFEPTAIGFVLWMSVLSFGFVVGHNTDVILNGGTILVWPVVAAVSLYVTTLCVSIGIYRLSINPLKKFPAVSTLAGLTKWQSFYVANQGDTHHYLLKKHRELGDFIRVGPNEISVADPTFIPIVHGNKSRFPKGPWYKNMLGEDPPALMSVLGYDEHKARRKVWDETFTPKALKVYAERISTLLDQLEARFKGFAKTKETFDLCTWTEHFFFDSIGRIAFNVEFRSIQDGKAHFYGDFIHAMLRQIASFANVSWIIPLLTYIPLDKKQAAEIKKFKSFSEEKLRERIKTSGSAEIDVLGFMMAAGDRNESLRLSHQALAAETGLVIAAGSDTTSIAIASAMYWLMLNKAVYTKLRAECLQIFEANEEFEAARLGDLKRAPYLNACINEALRLIPSGPNGMQRVVTTQGGLMGGGLHIPKGTKISVHPWTVHHDARNFEKPWDFIPERWIEGAKFQGVHNPKAFFPFSLGAYSCPGKSIALLQIRMFLFRVITKFDLEIAPGFNKRSFIEDTKAYFGIVKEPLHTKATLAS